MPKVAQDLKPTETVDVDTAVEQLDGVGQPSKEVSTPSEETTEEVKTAELEEETETEESEEEPSEEEEEDVSLLKERLAKAERDRDNYKKENLKYRVKGVVLPIEKEEKEKEEKTGDEIEQSVSRVLAKREQRLALASMLDSSSKDYIPELVNPDQRNEIFGYLPQNYDRTDARSVTRAVKVATAAWKYDHGIVEKKKPKGGTDAGLSGGDSTISTKKPEPTLNIPKSVPMAEWFK